MCKKLFMIGLFFISSSVLNAFSFGEKLATSVNGEYVVIAEGGDYEVLFIRSAGKSQIMFEEIRVPKVDIQRKNFSWKDWVIKGAPGHTGWLVYEVSLKKNELLSTYSYTKRTWMKDVPNHNFLTTLLSLPLELAKQEERKKVGPKPPAGDIDRRSLWTPAEYRDGKKMVPSTLVVYRGQWPSDGSEIACANVFFYFGTGSLPLWVDIETANYSQPVKIIDKGYDMRSPKPLPLTNE